VTKEWLFAALVNLELMEIQGPIRNQGREKKIDLDKNYQADGAPPNIFCPSLSKLPPKEVDKRTK
jgi:hypothetical protein